ncbi:MAG: hypothetical protein RCG16_04560 [Rickettsia hoogstraalii]
MLLPLRSSDVKELLAFKFAVNSLAPASPILLLPRLSDVKDLLSFKLAAKAIAPASPIL